MSAARERRMRVDPIKCNGYGYCAEIIPERVTLDDWGFPIVSMEPIAGDEMLSLARRAVATCPRLALMIEEVTGE